MFLINEISTLPLVNFRDMASDNDAYLPLKFTYKGPSGIGESGNKAVPDIYRYVHVSNLGIVDVSSSSPSDPGATSMLIPLINIDKNGYFKEVKEPNTWRKNLSREIKEFRKNDPKKEVIEFNAKFLSAELNEDGE